MHDFQADCVTAGLLLLLSDDVFEVPSWIIDVVEMDLGTVTAADVALRTVAA